VDYAIISGNIINSSGTAGFTKSGDGLLYLPGTNTYNGNTILGGGALLGDFGTGIPTNTTMVLMGGVFQPLNATSITRNIGIGSGQICWNTSAAGGGFAAHTNNINVNLFGDSRMISWGTDQSQNIIGPLKFNNVFSVGSVSFANSLNLAGGARTIQVDGTVADLSGAISGGSGSSLTKTGVATLTLSGTASNTYSGQTILKDGALNLNKTNAIAVPGDLIFDGTTASVVRLIRSNQLSSTSNVIWNDSTSSNYHYLEILGNTQTVASISNRTGFSIIENTESETGIGNGVLTVQNSTDCFYKGWMRNSNNGSGTLGLTKAGAGTLTLASCWYEGWGGYSYTGTTTISAGKLLLQDVNGFASPVVNNSALELRSSKAGLTFGQPISGTGSLSVSSDTTSGVVFLSNSTSNTYAGNTTLRGGGLVLNTTGGAIAIPGNLTITDAGNGYQTFVGLFAPNQFAATSSITFNGSAPGTTSFYMYGNAQTLAGINDSSGNALIGNGSADTPCTLTLSNCNSSYGGIITDYGPAPLSLVKTGGGQLTLNGTGVINLTGGITVNGGVLYLAKTSGVAVPGVLNMTATSGTSWVVVQGNNQLSTNATLNFPVGNYPYYPHFLLAGYNVTVAGISDSTGTGVIENMEDTAANTATLTINNSTNSFFNGFLRNAYSGNAPLAVIKNGAGTLTLSGNYANDFTGGLTINAGTVDFENTENDVAHPYTVNAGGHLVLNGVQLAAAASAMSLIAASETEDYANAVPDTNNGTMSIVGSTYFNARNLVGTGTLMVKDDAVVYAHSLVQDTLVIGGTSSYSPAVAVPEPGTMILLSLGVMALAGVGIGRKNRG
jgi:autotransporter-associated beta strand protein